MSPDKGWKQAERRIASRLGGRRIPVTGIDRHGADVETPLLCIQVKVRKSIPDWLFDWVGGIVQTALSRRKSGVLILKWPKCHDDGALVIMRLKDFEQLHGAVPQEVARGTHESDC